MLLPCMSIAGSVPLVLCILLRIIKRKNFSYWLGRDLVLLSLAGYLIPFQLVKYLLPTEVLERTNAVQSFPAPMDFDDKRALSYQGISIWMPDWFAMLLLCWLFLVLLFSVYEILKYHQLTRILKKHSTCQSKALPGFGTVNYRASDQISTPYTVGFLHPFIVIPENLLKNEFLDYILKHEYSHLHQHDSAVKLFCLFAICLHWFNPFAILTLVLYTCFSENIADEAATRECSKEQRKCYAFLLVSLSARNKEIPVVWRNNFTGNKNKMRRRIECIMNKNKKASKIRIAATILASMILSSSTVLAYSPMQTSSFKNNGNVSADGTMEFDTDNSTLVTFSEGSTYFETQDHEIIPIDASNISTHALICIHDFKVGYVKQHIPNKNTGGCVYKVYHGKVCKKCAHLVVEDLISTTTYVKCPH